MNAAWAAVAVAVLMGAGTGGAMIGRAGVWRGKVEQLLEQLVRDNERQDQQIAGLQEALGPKITSNSRGRRHSDR